MAKTKDAVLEICTKATLLGNKISVRMLEYLSTVKQHPEGFDSLAQDFLDICRILWSIEAGLNEFSRTNRKFPADMIVELERKFRSTFADFQTLDKMLARFLEYENRGTVGKIQKGFRKMFPDHEIDKMRDSLGRTREALRMSALVFEWSLGDARIDDSVGIGYTGLAAALDRMSKGRSVTGIAKVKSLEAGLAEVSIAPAAESPLPPEPVLTAPVLPALPQMHSVFSERDSAKDLLPPAPVSRGSPRDHTLKLLPEIQRHASLSTHSLSSQQGRDRVSTVGSLEKLNAMQQQQQQQLHHHLHSHPHTPMQQPSRLNSGSGMSSTPPVSDDTLFHEIDPLDTSGGGGGGGGGPHKVLRLKADPFTMPRWMPRNTAGGNATNLRAALITAVQGSNHNLIEQLLDRGVGPDTGPDTHVLNEAVNQHDSESIRLLLLFGADPNLPDRDGTTPLFAAVDESFLDGATMLLKYGADPNLAAGPESESPLAAAVVGGKMGFVQLLLTYGGNPNYMMGNGNTLLIQAVDKKSPAKHASLLLDYGADPDGKSREGKTALFEAITSGRVDIATSLLDHGANPNLPGPKHLLWPSTYQPACLQLLLSRGADPKKTSGIMELAASINSIESVRILLRHGVDPNAKKDGVYTPLCSSIRDNRADIVALLLASGADPNVMASELPAWKCVTHHRAHFLPALTDAGADLREPKGIVEMAVRSGNAEALTWLLDQGVSPNDRSAEGGYTPLTTAIRERKADVVALLLARGADPNLRGEDWPVCMAVRDPVMLQRLLPLVDDPRAHKGVLEMAVVADQLESVKLLLAAGVSVEDKNGGVFSPLTTAIREDRRDITRFLLSADGGAADPNAPGEHLPLVKAIRRFRGDTFYIDLLLANGADVNKTYRGWNAVMQAIENADATVLKLLVEKGNGVDLDVRDDAGRTVAEIASGRGWDEAAVILNLKR